MNNKYILHIQIIYIFFYLNNKYVEYLFIYSLIYLIQFKWNILGCAFFRF